MRTFIFLMCTTVFCLNTENSFSQKKVIIEKDQLVTIDQVFKIIKKQTDFNFVYHKRQFKDMPKVQLKKGEIQIAKLLQRTFSNSNVSFVLSTDNTIIIKEEKAIINSNPTREEIQQKLVNGLVTDNFSQPLPGATILIKGKSIGATTDFDGKFSIEAAVSDVLVFSYVGFLTKEMVLTNANIGSIKVSMQEDILQLDELVITGTSVLTKKRQLGNAISSIKSSAIKSSGSQDVTAALSGKLPGALVNQNSGNPAGGVSVTLRGASTVFGSSDPLYVLDGVIVDNSSTELLPLGGYAQNRLVDLNTNDIDRIEIIKGAAAAAIYGSRASNGVVQIFTKRGASGETKISFSSSIKVNQLRKQIEENQEPFQFEAPGSSVLVPVERFRMQDRIFRDAYGTNNNISISGGDDNTQFYTSGSFSKNGGIIKNTDFKRYTLRANVDEKINDWLKASVSTHYSISDSKELPNGGMLAPGEFFGVLTGFAFLNTNYDPDRQPDGSYINNLGFTLAANPVAAIENYDFRQKTNRFIGSLRLEASLSENLNLEYILGYDGSSSRATAFIPVGILPKVTGWSRTAEKTSLLLNNDLNIQYSLDLTENIKSVSSLGFTQQYERTTILSNTADRLSPSIQSTTGGSIIARTDLRSERSIRGGYFQQTLNFSDRFFLTGAVRLDQASTFGVNERTQFYPKASFSYLLSDEAFWKKSLGKVFNVFKLRSSYGEAGNLTALSAFDKLTNYNPVPIGGQTGFAPDAQSGNLDIKPERQKEIEIGFDASTFDGRLGIEFSWFDVKVEDLLLSRVLAPSTGFSRRLENVGTLTNKGFEILLKGQIARTKDFSWDVTAIYSKNKNEVNDIEGGQLILPDIFDQAVVAQNGEAIGVFSGTYFIRDANGAISTDAGGLPITSTDKRIIGDPNPEWTGSLINEIRYKNWRLRTQFDAVMGFDVFNWTDRLNSFTDLFGGGRRDAQEIRGELPRGYNGATFQTFERYVEDGSFVKLRELSLAYNFNLKSENIDNITVTLTGRNLFSIDDYSGWDPEVSSFGQRNGFRGMDFNEVPIPRTIELGVNVNF
ncbi:TonB-dependent receptor plug domain-containing protein [Flavivirga spongiicola]|uniref:TonB-dependent receptor n=1 Tax=Flavivirga spongiicola TaxID=421621 RepID=A0ABU7XYF8_9FLAO|nr:TonB-dependent receptor plug domain-containing protein [Flavivirga sp. MEBiC05379]MDO5980812.1 TonB-dependent receptor [Flavivirga sp. MEBiC05379]